MNPRIRTVPLAVITALCLLPACDKADPKCGRGTKLVGDECVAEAAAKPKAEAPQAEPAPNPEAVKPGTPPPPPKSDCDPEFEVKVPPDASVDDLLAKYTCDGPFDEKKETALKKENPVRSLKLIKASPDDYVGKPTTFVGTLEIDDYFNYDFDDKTKFYSLKFKMFGDDEESQSVHVYAPKSKFADFFKLVDKLEGEKRRITFKITAKIKNAENADMWELEAGQPYIDWWRGACCSPHPLPEIP